MHINLYIFRKRILLNVLFSGIMFLPVSSQESISSRGIELPPYIQQITTFGQRADWYHDGSKLLFLEKTYGDVYEYNFNTGNIIPLTHHFYHGGFTRALYLSNGDILLSGAMTFDAKNAFTNRVNHPELWVLDKSLTKPPVSLGEKCSEGPAVSRTSMKIAWVQEWRQYPEKYKEGEDEMFIAELVYNNDIPELSHKRKIFPKGDRGPHGRLEPQNFIRPDESMLTFSSYDYGNSEVMGLKIESGEVRNFSGNVISYDEPEGIFPDGKASLVECDKQNEKGIQFIDIWKLQLDGSGDYERITYFNDFEEFKSSNPVVSDDGKFIAFQIARVGDPPGVGRGIFIYDIEKKENLRPGKWTSLNPAGKPDPRHENAFVVHDSLFYLLGGRGIKPVNIFDPESGEWKNGSPPPIELHHFQAVAFSEDIYIIGAMTGKYPNEKPVEHIYVYSPRKDTWRRSFEIPASARRGAAGVVLDGNLAYIIGGIVDGHNGGFTNRMDVVNLTSGKWRKLPAAPHTRDHFHAVRIKNEIYAAGGRNTSGNTGEVFSITIASVDVYDITTDKWKTLDVPVPTPRAGASAVSLNGQLFIVGGESGATDRAHPEVELFDPETQSWQKLSRLNQGRHGTQAVVYKNRIYIASGSGKRGGSPELNTIEMFTMD